jgi:hypothetical protein
MNQYDVSILCIRMYGFECAFYFQKVISSHHIFVSGSSLVRHIYNMTSGAKSKNYSMVT